MKRINEDTSVKEKKVIEKVIILTSSPPKPHLIVFFFLCLFLTKAKSLKLVN